MHYFPFIFAVPVYSTQVAIMFIDVLAAATTLNKLKNAI